MSAKVWSWSLVGDLMWSTTNLSLVLFFDSLIVIFFFTCCMLSLLLTLHVPFIIKITTLWITSHFWTKKKRQTTNISFLSHCHFSFYLKSFIVVWTNLTNGKWRSFCLTQVWHSSPGASPAAPCAGCIQTSIPHLSVPRLGSDRPPAEKLRLPLLPRSCTWPGIVSEQVWTCTDTQRNSYAGPLSICIKFPYWRCYKPACAGK